MQKIISITGTIDLEQGLIVDGGITIPVLEYYEGAYTFAPSADPQTIDIKGKTALRDITIEAVDMDYDGLANKPQINGVTLTGNKTTADLHIDAGVTSWNGQTGAVTYTAPVTSVNRQTGDVTIAVPEKTSELDNDAGYITAREAPVQSVNRQTGDVEISVPSKTSQLTNDSGFVTSAQAASAAPVQTVNGQTGNVTVTVPTDTGDLTNNAGFVTAAGAAAAAPVQSVNGSTGAVTVADNKVEQTSTTTSGYSNWRAILVGYGSTGTWNADIATNTQTCRIFNNLRFQPSTGTLRTTTFYGNLTGTASGNLTSSSTLNPAKLSGVTSGGTQFLRSDGTWADLPVWDGGVE